MIEILPAIIPKSYDDLQERVASVSYFTTIVHLDVCDGQFVTARSWPYTLPGDKDFENVITQEKGLPHWDEVDYEAHIMVANPRKEIDRWIQAGVRRIVVHIESEDSVADIISDLQEKYAYTNEPGYDSIELGLAVNLQTSITALLACVEKVHFVQFMGIRRVGYQGQEVDPSVFEKIKELRAKFPNIPISGDGGVTIDNAHEWVKAGATRLVSGSAIYQSDNISETIDELRILDEKIKQGLV